jgi:GAF domain-containing protein
MIDGLMLFLKDLWENYLRARITPEADTLTHQRQRLLHYILLSFSGMSILFMVPAIIDANNSIQSWEIFLTLVVASIIVWIATLNQSWPYYVRTAVLLGIFYSLVVYDMLTLGLVGVSSLILLVIPLLVFTLLNLQAGIFATIANIGLYIFMGWQHSANNLPLNATFIDLLVTADSWWIISLVIGALCMLSTTLLGELSANVGQALYAEAELDKALEQEQSLLQTRIANRTRGLQASTEVSRRISTILNSQELAETVVAQIKSGFSFYHVQLYQFDAEKQYLYLIAATGTAGEKLRQQRHRLAIWRGLVGHAGGSGEPVLVENVQENSDWVYNPDLPDTVSEVAIPVKSADEIIGVLDIQHNEEGRLDEDTVYVLQTIASQVAVSFQNADLYEQAEAQAQREALLDQISQKIQLATATDEVLRIATTELAQALNLKKAEIKLGLQSQN